MTIEMVIIFALGFILGSGVTLLLIELLYGGDKSTPTETEVVHEVDFKHHVADDKKELFKDKAIGGGEKHIEALRFLLKKYEEGEYISITKASKETNIKEYYFRTSLEAAIDLGIVDVIKGGNNQVVFAAITPLGIELLDSESMTDPIVTKVISECRKITRERRAKYR